MQITLFEMINSMSKTTIDAGASHSPIQKPYRKKIPFEVIEELNWASGKRVGILNQDKIGMKQRKQNEASFGGTLYIYIR